MPLTDTAIRKTKPSKVAQKLRDGRGLYLLIKPNDSRLWRWDYRRPVTGKRNTLSLGTYPEVSLADARERLISFFIKNSNKGTSKNPRNLLR